MKIGVLLEALIQIAQISKTDFAISMNMTPSGLSKILTGKRLPFRKEKKSFCKQAANYFAEALYGPNCHLKFEPIFPLIYNFSAKYELELFLSSAVEYALNQDYSTEDNVNFDYPDQETSFLGTKPILNMFCILVSDYIVRGEGAPLEFYSNLPLFSRLYSDIFHRIKVLNIQKQSQVFFHHFVDLSKLELSYDEYHMNIFSALVEIQQHVDLTLWKTKQEIGHSFLFLKGRFQMQFTIQMDGTPLMTFITHKQYLSVFYHALMKQNAKKISYSREEAFSALEKNPSLVDQLINRGIDAVYNFIPIGYLVDQKELDGIDISQNIKAAVLKVFTSIMTGNTDFYVTIEAMLRFFSTKKIIVPPLGAIDIAPENRISYLQRLERFMNKETNGKIHILDCEPPKVAVLCARDLGIVYFIDNDYASEKIHFFETEMLHTILAGEIANGNMKTIDFNPDLWDTYLDELSKRIDTPGL